MANNTGFGVFLDFLHILVRKKRVIIVATFIPTLISIVLVLIATSVYKSEALVNPPKSEGGGGAMSALQDLGSGAGMGGLLGSFLGGGETGLDDCVSILQSARFANLVIDRFDLETSYKFKSEKNPKKYFHADVLKQFRRNAVFNITDENAIVISMKDTSAVRAQEMTLYMVHLLDSLYTDVQKTTTQQRLGYIDERLAGAEAEMKILEDSLVGFQNKHNLLIPETQVRMILQNAAQTEIRLETVKEELALEAALRGKSGARYQDLEIQRRLLEKTLQNQISSPAASNSLMLPTQTLPALATEYFRLERAYMVRLGVYKFLVQQAEMLKLDANKNILVISMLDPPWVNDKRISPRRRVIVQSVFTISLLISCFLVVLFEAWRRHRSEHPESAMMAEDIRRSLLRL